MFFDWLIVGQILEVNPAHAVREPKHFVTEGRTPVLNRDAARTLLSSVDTSTLKGLRDRALIAVMIYTFARVGAVQQMNVGDYFSQGRRGWVRLHGKGGKEHEAPELGDEPDHSVQYTAKVRPELIGGFCTISERR